jgi:tRNA(His) 5'-end guanylyltransferase
MSRLKDSDDFGNRMKAYEAVETARKLDPLLPIYARIDGRSFSRFTRGMDRPFDARMTAAMIETTKHLVHETHARIGYTQSDEISLVWLAEGSGSDMLFSGKVQKMASVLASMAAAKFARVCPPGYENRLPHFDCRVFQLPSKEEAANTFLWRAMDARKNAISMVAQSKFSPKKLHGKDQKAMLAMLAEIGVNFGDFPEAFRRGTFVRRIALARMLTDEELLRIPEKHRPTGLVMRNEMRVVKMPAFNNVKNRVAVIFEGAQPVTARSAAMKLLTEG